MEVVAAESVVRVEGEVRRVAAQLLRAGVWRGRVGVVAWGRVCACVCGGVTGKARGWCGAAGWARAPRSVIMLLCCALQLPQRGGRVPRAWCFRCGAAAPPSGVRFGRACMRVAVG